MEYYNQQPANADTRVSSGPLESLKFRLEGLSKRIAADMSGVADKLNEHADRIHGSVPAPVGGADSQTTVEPDCGPGVLGELFRAMSNLEYQYGMAMEAVAVAAGRNTTLA